MGMFQPFLLASVPPPLWLKRYRCPNCGCIILMRPASHFSRFQASRETIRFALEQRINHGRWPPDLTPVKNGTKKRDRLKNGTGE